MRIRRRPALQDKTPGNTPQSRHSTASKEAPFSAPHKPLDGLSFASEAASDENGTLLLVPPSPKPHHVRRIPQPPPETLEDTSSELSTPPTPTPARNRRPGGRATVYSPDLRSGAAHRSDVTTAIMLPEVLPVVSDENGTLPLVPPSPKPHHVRRVPQPPPETLEDTSSELSAPPTPTPARIRRPSGRAVDAVLYSSDIRSDAAHRSDVLTAAMLPVREGREPLSYGASSDSSGAPSPSLVKTMKWPASVRRPLAPPKFRPLVENAHARMPSSSRPSGSLRPSDSFAPPPPPFFEQRTPSFVPPTPRPKHVQRLLRPANDVEGVLASPTPAKTGLGPLIAQSTPLQFRTRRPRIPLNNFSRTADAVATTSKAKGKQRAREESLPPSSPPPSSPAGSLVPFAVRADLMAALDDEPLEPEDKENTSAVPLQKERSRSSEDDPFGFLAAERKLKTIRREKGQGSEQSRRPLGTLTVSRRTQSPSPAPLQLPTPDGDSDADGDPEDNRFFGVGSPGLARAAQAQKLSDTAASDPVIQLVYDDHSDALSYADPDEDMGDLEAEDQENAPPNPAELVSTSRAQPRTPHKPKTARQRSPLDSPHFEDDSDVGEGTPSRSTGPVEELERPNLRPVRERLPSSAAQDDDAVEEELIAGSVQESDDEEEATPRPPAPVIRKRRLDDEDPMKAAKKLEKLLPRRPAKRARRASNDESEASEPLAKRTRGRGRGRARARGGTRGGVGRGRGRGKGKVRAEEGVSEGESESETDEEVEEVVEPKSSSGRGRGSSRGGSRGTSNRPPSSSTRVTRSRSQKPPSKPDSKGKKRARDEEEEIDIEEDEVSASRLICVAASEPCVCAL